jgi:hypothetical protein
MRFESDHPRIRYHRPWQARQVSAASRGQYHRTDQPQSAVSLTFEGQGLRIQYVAARNMGVFDVLVDGQRIDTIDASSDERHFSVSDVYVLEPGGHELTLRLREGGAIGLDAVDVFRAPPNTLIIPPVATGTPVPAPQPVREMALVAAPPTTVPSEPQRLHLSVVIAYDENGNDAVDPAEGVQGVPVRAVAAGSNEILAAAVTDERGYAHVEVITAGELRLVAPYLGAVWEVRAGSTRDDQVYSLLLEAGTQPGFIP